MTAQPLPTWQDIEPDLVRWAQNGDEDAFMELWEHYLPLLADHLNRRLNHESVDVDDVLQDTCIRAWERLRAVTFINSPHTGRPALKAWLVMIAHNRAIDLIRRANRWRMVPLESDRGNHHTNRIHALMAGDPESNPAVTYEMRQDAITVHRILWRLSPRHRRALALREYYGLSCEEIGQRMGLSRSAVKSALFRAREEARKVARQLGITAEAWA